MTSQSKTHLNSRKFRSCFGLSSLQTSCRFQSSICRIRLHPRQLCFELCVCFGSRFLYCLRGLMNTNRMVHQIVLINILISQGKPHFANTLHPTLYLHASSSKPSCHSLPVHHTTLFSKIKTVYLGFLELEFCRSRFDFRLFSRLQRSSQLLLLPLLIEWGTFARFQVRDVSLQTSIFFIQVSGSCFCLGQLFCCSIWERGGISNK